MNLHSLIKGFELMFDCNISKRKLSEVTKVHRNNITQLYNGSEKGTSHKSVEVIVSHFITLAIEKGIEPDNAVLLVNRLLWTKV